MGKRRAPELLPYARHQLFPEDLDAVRDTLRGPSIAQGPEVARFEDSLASATDRAHAVAVSSGTAALHVALGALGVGPGDEVIVPPLTFLATANAVLFCGATPVFADIDPRSLNLSPDAVERAITPRTVGAVPVHFGGHPAEVASIAQRLGDERFVLEDACHALGADVEGKPAGALGDAACFSFALRGCCSEPPPGLERCSQA